MSVSVTVLASGSRGNCAGGGQRLHADSGRCRHLFAAKCSKRLKALGEDPQALSAIVITHEHCDHVYGLATLAKKLRIPVFHDGGDASGLGGGTAQRKRRAAGSWKNSRRSRRGIASSRRY